MDQIQQMLKPELLIMAAAFVGGYQTVWRVFDAVKILPAIPLWLVPLLMVPTGFVLAFRYSQLNPIPLGAPHGLSDDWGVQGAFLVFVMLAGWLTALLAFNGKPSNGTSSSSALGRAMNSTGTVSLLLWAFLISGAFSTAALAAPAAGSDDVLRWDPKRFTVGVRAWGVIHEDLDAGSGAPTTSAFKGDAFANWNLSRHLNIFAGYAHEFSARPIDEIRIGGSGQLVGIEPGSTFALFMGANWIRISGEGADAFVHAESWEAYLQGVQVLAKTKAGRPWLGLVLAGKIDPNNDRKTGQLGLDFHPIGGKP